MNDKPKTAYRDAASIPYEAPTQRRVTFAEAKYARGSSGDPGPLFGACLSLAVFAALAGPLVYHLAENHQSYALGLSAPAAVCLVVFAVCVYLAIDDYRVLRRWRAQNEEP